jgi:hypothetical protein
MAETDPGVSASGERCRYSSQVNMSYYQLSMHEYHRLLLVVTAGRTRARGDPGDRR